MKQIRRSVLSALIMGGTIYAGGDIAPVEPIVETPAVVELSPFYVGVGVGQADVNNKTSLEKWESNTFVLQAGYRFNPYVAVEGRYSFGFNMDYSRGITTGIDIVTGLPLDNDFSSWGLYVKPSYPIGDLSLYALLGFGGVQLSNINGGDAYEDGFQWGLGVSYSVTEQISVFVDYVALYDDTGFDYVGTAAKWDADTWTIGVSYRF